MSPLQLVLLAAPPAFIAWNMWRAHCGRCRLAAASPAVTFLALIPLAPLTAGLPPLAKFGIGVVVGAVAFIVIPPWLTRLLHGCHDWQVVERLGRVITQRCERCGKTRVRIGPHGAESDSPDVQTSRHQTGTERPSGAATGPHRRQHASRQHHRNEGT